MTKNTLLATTVALSLAACVNTSEPVPVGPDSYMISASASDPGITSAPSVLAARHASQFCEENGRHMVIRHMETGFKSGTLVFSCVTDTDPEYKRPNLRKDADVVVERSQP
jgi:hypothetical protein